MAALLQKTSFAVATRGVAKANKRSVVVKGRGGDSMWYPDAVAPAHLNGTVPGDFGCDPLQLATTPERMGWLRDAEIYNGRWAMFGAVGMVVPDLVGLPKWYEAGAQPYWVDTITQLYVLAAFFGVTEAFRYNQIKTEGPSATAFDPLKLRTPTTELNEVLNGRLAMFACLGMWSTYAVNGESPLESLSRHLADPAHNNVFLTSVGPETTLALSILSVVPIVDCASKSLAKDSKTFVFPWNNQI